MKKFIVVVVFGIAIWMNPIYASGATLCYSMQAGLLQAYFYLSGGKIDQKPFSGKYLNLNVPCEVSVWASVVTDSDGAHYITINRPHASENVCGKSVWFHAAGQSMESMDGELDLNQDGTYEGTFSLSKINCDSIEQQ